MSSTMWWVDGEVMGAVAMAPDRRKPLAPPQPTANIVLREAHGPERRAELVVKVPPVRTKSRPS